MHLRHGLHLAYCTNVLAAETWPETFGVLDTTLRAVRDRLARPGPFALGLRLSDQAAAELAADATARAAFRRWLDRENFYLFTINGFPFGRFHGTRVKEEVYRPDWSRPERLTYTVRLFALLAEFLPEGLSGSVSTLPGSFKAFGADETAIRRNLWSCIEQIADLSDRTGKDLHLGVEPEPLGLFETSTETVAFFERMRADRPSDDRLARHLGVNYDTCHLAVEFEQPADVLARFRQSGIRLSKIHLSAAPALVPSDANIGLLRDFHDEVYLHQVVARFPGSSELRRFRDLPDAFADAQAAEAEEWRVHFHIPLQTGPGSWFRPTTDHLLGVLDHLAEDPALCTHLEMETYTWAVLPPALRSASIADQIAAEYRWTLEQLARRGLA